MAALFRPKMTIEATDLKFLGMYSVRISDRLHRLITLLVSRKARGYRQSEENNGEGQAYAEDER